MAHSSGRVRPVDLVLRCYARRTGTNRDKWIAHCVDLDLWAAGKSFEGARESMDLAVRGYLATVFDTQDRDSIPRLIRRRAALRYLALWYVISLWSRLSRNGRRPLDTQPFEETLPWGVAIA